MQQTISLSRGEADTLVGNVEGDGSLLEEGVTDDPAGAADVGTNDGEHAVARAVGTVCGCCAEVDGLAAKGEADGRRAVAVVSGGGLALAGGVLQTERLEESLCLAGRGDDQGGSRVNNTRDCLVVGLSRDTPVSCLSDGSVGCGRIDGAEGQAATATATDLEDKGLLGKDTSVDQAVEERLLLLERRESRELNGESSFVN